jgi:transcriptional regulator with XRE-family HTH domain
MIDVEIYEKLQRAMNVRGIGVSELARRSGMPQPSVSEYVKGDIKTYPLRKTALLARALEVPLEYIADPADTPVPAAPDPREVQVREIAAMHSWDLIYRILIAALRPADPPTAPPADDVRFLGNRNRDEAIRAEFADHAARSAIEADRDDKPTDLPDPPRGQGPGIRPRKPKGPGHERD